MGGGYYDREDDNSYSNNVSSSYVSNSNSNDYSKKADLLIGKNTQLAFSLDPKRWNNYFDQKLICNGGDPIVFALDVTGSMGDWSKVTICLF